jgi:tetratricopeptide (TPR) repeat protein
MTTIPWHQLHLIVEKMSHSAYGPGILHAEDINMFTQSLHMLKQTHDTHGILQLRHMCTPMLERDSAWGIHILRHIDDTAICVARTIQAIAQLAIFLMARGHNLHREGRHDEALTIYHEAIDCFTQCQDTDNVLRATFMSSLCIRALQRHNEAVHIVNIVLHNLPQTSPWYDEPVLMLGRLAQDTGDISNAYVLMQKALSYARQSPEPRAIIRVAGILADIGEIDMLRRHYADAERAFNESIAIINQFPGQYNRILARTLIKFAELRTQQRCWTDAHTFLDRADDLVSRYGAYYDLIWRIELLRCYVYMFQLQWGHAIRKLRLFWYYRHQLHQAHGAVIWQIIQRLYRKLGNVIPHKN